MNTEKFAEIHRISKAKAKAMAPYIKGAQQCSCCKGWNIPENSKPIYIPDKRKYRRNKEQYCHMWKYCYMLDAIALDMEIEPNLLGMDENTYKTLLKELYRNGFIVRKENSQDNSLYHLDYIISLQFGLWEQKRTQEKLELICNIVQNCTDTVKETIKVVEKISMVKSALLK